MPSMWKSVAVPRRCAELLAPPICLLYAGGRSQQWTWIALPKWSLTFCSAAACFSMLDSTVSIDVLVTSLGLTWRPHDGRNSASCQVSDEPGIAVLKFLAIASYCGCTASLDSPGFSWCSSL